MIKHIVLWTAKPTADGFTAAENALRMKESLESLAGRIPGLLHLEVGIDLSRTSVSADVALYSEFPDRESLAGYVAHPEHVAVARFVDSLRETRLVADYEV
jgi:hypothetical protein